MANSDGFLEFDHFGNREDGVPIERKQSWEPETCFRCGRLLNADEAGECVECKDDEDGNGESDKKLGVDIIPCMICKKDVTHDSQAQRYGQQFKCGECHSETAELFDVVNDYRKHVSWHCAECDAEVLEGWVLKSVDPSKILWDDEGERCGVCSNEYNLNTCNTEVQK